jgi:hypothetical protein
MALKAAQELGRRGGLVGGLSTSPAKRRAARKNIRKALAAKLKAARQQKR